MPLNILENGYLHRVDPNTGGWRELPQKVWNVGPVAMCKLGNSIYVIENATLYRVDPGTGDFVSLGQNWGAPPIAMVGHGDHLYVIENATLYRVDPGTGQPTSLGQNWGTPPLALASLGSHLFVIENSTLHRVDPSSGAFDSLGQNWGVPPIALAAHGAHLYVIENATLYRVEPNTGQFTSLGQNWGAPPIAIIASDLADDFSPYYHVQCGGVISDDTTGSGSLKNDSGTQAVFAAGQVAISFPPGSTRYVKPNGGTGTIDVEALRVTPGNPPSSAVVGTVSLVITDPNDAGPVRALKPNGTVG